MNSDRLSLSLSLSLSVCFYHTHIPHSWTHAHLASLVHQAHKAALRAVCFICAITIVVQQLFEVASQLHVYSRDKALLLLGRII